MKDKKQRQFKSSGKQKYVRKSWFKFTVQSNYTNEQTCEVKQTCEGLGVSGPLEI